MLSVASKFEEVCQENSPIINSVTEKTNDFWHNRKSAVLVLLATEENMTANFEEIIKMLVRISWLRTWVNRLRWLTLKKRQYTLFNTQKQVIGRNTL